jgi:hypothetical protein
MDKFHFFCFPHYVLFGSFLIALLYLFIPITNFWVYNLVKNQIWDVVSTFVFGEIFYSTLPDCNETIYSLAYIFGLLAPTIVFSIAYSIDMKNNALLNLFAPCAGAYFIVIMYLLDVLLSTGYQRTEVSESSTARSISTSDVTTAIDIFNACILQPDSGNSSECSTTENPVVKADIEMRPSTVSISSTLADRHLSESLATKASAEIPQQQASSSKSSSRIRALSSLVNTNISKWRSAWLKSKQNKKTTSPLPYDSQQPDDNKCCSIYLPRQVYDNILHLPPGMVKVGMNRLWIWLITTCFVFSIQGFYFFLNFFTDAFRAVPEHDNFQRIQLFVVYIIVCMILKTIIKRLGMYLDCMKLNTSSLYFVGEVIGLMFYFTFYRVLFESIVIWWEFLLFQVLHVMSEWILYPFRASKVFYRLQKRFFAYFHLDSEPESHI